MVLLLVIVSVAPLVTPAHAQVTISALDWTTTTAQMGAVVVNHVRVTNIDTMNTHSVTLSLVGSSGSWWVGSFSPSTLNVPASGSLDSTLTIPLPGPADVCPTQNTPGPYSLQLAVQGSDPALGTIAGPTLTINLLPTVNLLSVNVEASKASYMKGETVTLRMDANLPAQYYLTVKKPDGSNWANAQGYLPASFTKKASDPIGTYTAELSATYCGTARDTTSFVVTSDTYEVTISLAGLPPDATTALLVDGNKAADMKGSDVKVLSYPIGTSHTFQVEQFVNDAAGSRYYCADNKWTTVAWESHVFDYVPQPVAAATISIPVTIKGLSPQLSVSMTIDGKNVGTIPGGGTKTFNVDKSKSHTFEVGTEIKGNCATYEGTDVCTRYSNSNNVWTLDVISTQNCQEVPVCYDTYYYCDYYGYCWYVPYCTYENQCWTAAELSEKGHTFAYTVEQEVVVNDIHGQSTDIWKAVDSNVALSANEFVVTRNDSNVKERDIFVRWLVNGAPMEGRTLTLKADKPLFIKAEYQTETEYHLTVSASPFEVGQISLNPSSSDYWYSAGASIQVTAVVLTPSHVFSYWELDGTDVGAAQTYSLVMDSPHQLTAVFSVVGIVTTETTTRSSTETTHNQSQPPEGPSPLFTASILVAAVSVAALVALGISRSRRSHAVPPSPRICSSCGFENPPYTRAFCVNCGSPLEEL